MKKEVSNYIKGRVTGLLDEIRTFGSEIESKNAVKVNKVNKIHESKGEEVTYKDFKEDLVSINKNHYLAFLYEESMKGKINRFLEIYNTAKAFEVDLGLDEEREAMAENIANGNKDMFTVNNNKVEVVNQELYSQMITGVEKNSNNEEALKKLYENIVSR